MNNLKECSVLIIEDEPQIAELIFLSLIDLELKIDKVYSAEQAQFLLQSKKYALIIADWMLPGLQGIDLLRNVKSNDKNQLGLMITAKADPESIVSGLEAGADDYLIKPFDPRVLNSRVKNLLKRYLFLQELTDKYQRSNLKSELTENQKQILEQEDIIFLSELKIDYRRVEVSLRNEIIHLTPSEFKLLGFLVKSQGRVLTREQLIDLIQGEEVSVTGRTIDTHVFALRKKLKDWSSHVETIRGVGYRVNYSL